MNEVMLGLRAILGITLMSIPAFFGMCGGRSISQLKKVGLDLGGWSKANRFWGRWVAPVIGSLIVFGIAWWSGHLSWWLICFIIAFKGVHHLPHSQPYQRAIKGLIWPLCGVFLCFISGLWSVLLLQVIIAFSAQLILGLLNTLLAPEEEVTIYFSMSFLFPCMVL